MDNSKEIVSLRPNRTDTHMNSQTLREHIQDKPDKIPAWTRGVDTKVLPTAKKLFEIDTCGGRENQFSPAEGHWVYRPYSRAGSCPGVVGQHKTGSIHYLFTFCSGLFCLIDFPLFSFIHFDFHYCCFLIAFFEK